MAQSAKSPKQTCSTWVWTWT